MFQLKSILVFLSLLENVFIKAKNLSLSKQSPFSPTSPFFRKKKYFFYCQIRESQFPTFVKGVGAVRTMPWLDFLENEGDSRKPKKVEELV